MPEITDQIVEKIKGLGESEQKRILDLIQILENEQIAKIVVSMDSIGCYLYHVPSDLIHPDKCSVS